MEIPNCKIKLTCMMNISMTDSDGDSVPVCLNIYWQYQNSSYPYQAKCNWDCSTNTIANKWFNIWLTLLRIFLQNLSHSYILTLSVRRLCIFQVILYFSQYNCICYHFIYMRPQYDFICFQTGGIGVKHYFPQIFMYYSLFLLLVLI